MSGTRSVYRMLDNLTARLARIVKQVRGEARLTESNIQDALREVRVALLEADVALPVVKHFVDSVRAKALGEEVAGSLTPGQALVAVVHRELAALMGEANVGLNLATQPPAVILMAGLQGSGRRRIRRLEHRREAARHRAPRARAREDALSGRADCRHRGAARHRRRNDA